MSELYELSLKQASVGLREKKFSSKDLLESTFKRIQKVENKVDAFLLLTKEIAERQADKADELLKRGEAVSPLTGIPASLKDILVTEGVRTTAASKVLENFIPPYSATVVERLEKAGLVLLGKNNLDEFACGASTENSAYKTTKNPWDTNRVPGGSSGGSTAAVAADMAYYSIGSDTGGSIRQPASFCGVVGLKPTYGRVSRYGLLAMASSLDQIGPIAKTVEDAALVLQEIAGFDLKDATSTDREVPDFAKLDGVISGLKVGLPKEFLGEGVSNQVSEVIKKAVSRLESLGAQVQEISLPRTREAISVYYLLMPSELSSNLARYDGIRFGEGREKFGPEIKRRVMLGTYTLSSGYYDAYYLKAAKVRTLIKEDFESAFKKVDVVVGPTSPVLPFKIGERADDPIAMYLADILTVPVNLAGLPAISIPCGLVEGLPVGFQIIGKPWAEKEILNTAYAYEQSFPFTEKPKLN